MSVLKGDILNYLNIKCAVKLDLYWDFALAMLVVPFAFVVGLMIDASSRVRQRRKTQSSGNIFSILERSIGTASFDPAAPQNLMVSTAGERQDLGNGSGQLNRMFILLFCIYPFLVVSLRSLS